MLKKGVAEEAVKNRMLVMLDDVEAIKPGETLTDYQKQLLELKKKTAKSRR